MILFSKYQGAGNDFVIIDNRKGLIVDDVKVDYAKKLCDRKFGVGSDGLILIENSVSADFKMDFLNPDGSRSFCGNGSRCAVKFCTDNNILNSKKLRFEAIDGVHFAELIKAEVKIEMKNVNEFTQENGTFFIDTGSPHFIKYENSISELNVVKEGRKIRYSDTYKDEGTNVNFIEEINDAHIKVRTYERGVEDETLACGTGVTACALSYAVKHGLKSGVIHINAIGGVLSVGFKLTDSKFNHIWLQGPAEFVFKGKIHV